MNKIKIYKFLTITFAALFLVSLAATQLLDRVPVSDVSNDAVMIVTLFLFISLPFALLFGYQYADASVTKKRAEAADPSVKSRYYKDSIIASRIALVLYAEAVIVDILYYIKWKPLEPDCIVMAVMLIIFHSLLFLLPAILFHRQSNRDKYIDKCDAPDGRKVRLALLSAVIILVILAVIGSFAVVQAHTMTNYIYKSRTGDYES